MKPSPDELAESIGGKLTTPPGRTAVTPYHTAKMALFNDFQSTRPRARANSSAERFEIRNGVAPARLFQDRFRIGEQARGRGSRKEE